MSVLAAPQEQSLFSIWLRDNVLSFSPKPHCLFFQHLYVLLGKEQGMQDACVSSALCLQQHSHLQGANLPSCHQEGESTLQRVTVFTSSLLTD